MVGDMRRLSTIRLYYYYVGCIRYVIRAGHVDIGWMNERMGVNLVN